MFKCDSRERVLANATKEENIQITSTEVSIFIPFSFNFNININQQSEETIPRLERAMTRIS